MFSIRQACISDAPQLASLIMQAMSEECCAYFYGPQHSAPQFHRFLTELATRTDSQYSYRNALVAVEEDHVVGTAVSYDGATLHELRKSFQDGMLEQFNRNFYEMDDETQGGELYLDSLAVEERFRHRGMATQLINVTIDKARKLSIPCVGLLVDDDNPKALQLYRSLGFQMVGVSSWGGHGMKHLQKDVMDQ